MSSDILYTLNKSEKTIITKYSDTVVLERLIVLALKELGKFTFLGIPNFGEHHELFAYHNDDGIKLMVFLIGNTEETLECENIRQDSKYTKYSVECKE